MEPIATRQSLPSARRRWARVAIAGSLAATLFVAAIVAWPPPARACSPVNPICWIKEAIDFLKDIVGGAAMLLEDIITLDPQEFFEDLADIGEDLIFCDGLGIPEVTYVEFLLFSQGAETAEELFDRCAASEALDPAVRAKLETYYRSDFSSVRIHRDCDFELDGGRAAITFGEHIYFKRGRYAPLCATQTRCDGGPRDNQECTSSADCEGFGCVDALCSCRDGMNNNGFGLLAHELMHVLQYRREGFKDFICMWTLECAIAAGGSVDCPFEQQAYVAQAIVIEDMKRDGDGIPTCPLGECDDEGGVYNNTRAQSHSCVAEVNLCGATLGDPDAADYCASNDNCPDRANRDQADSDADGRGDACDEDCPGIDPDPLPFEDLDSDCVLDVADNCTCDPADLSLLTDCDSSNDPPASTPPGSCLATTDCFATNRNPDQADNEGDGLGDVCDPDDDDDGLEDDVEQALGTDPLDADSDDDGLGDGEEVINLRPAHPCLDPLNPDSDSDGLLDGDELLVRGTDVCDPDTDDDGLDDGVEVGAGTDPLNSDTDDDGIPDGSDVEFLQNVLLGLPDGAFQDEGGGLRSAILRHLDAVERRVAREDTVGALDDLRRLRTHLDGCGMGPDSTDLIVDCASQVRVRELLDVLIANLEA